MTTLLKIRNANVSAGSSLPYRPVAIFVGGTSGIGAAMAKAFAQHRNGDAHIVIVGRNRAAAQELIDSFPKPPGTYDGEEPKHEFVECDVTLMKNVRQTTSELVTRLPKLNFLVLSPGIMTTKGRDETSEGIDRKLSLHYYARWRFTHDLIPLLQKAVDSGEDAKVMTVLSGLEAGEVDLNDLGLKNNYSLANAAKYASTHNNLMVQTFAEKYPSMAFTHIFPGIVRTPLLAGSGDWKLRLVSPLSQAIGWLAGVSPEQCAEYMWRGLYAGKNGWFRRDSHGEDVSSKPFWCSPEARQKLWQHTLEATS